MTDISLKEAIRFAFKKVRENFFLFLDLGVLTLLMVIIFIVALKITNYLIFVLLSQDPSIRDAELGGLFFMLFMIIAFDLGILIPIFTLRVVSVVNTGLVRISFKLINNESVEFKDIYSLEYLFSKLDNQTKKFSLASSLLILSVISLLPLIGLLLMFTYAKGILILNILYIPCIILWFILFLRFIFSGYLIIDKNLGIKESFKKSFMLTGHLTNNLSGLFRLLVLSIFQLITFLWIFMLSLFFYSLGVRVMLVSSSFLSDFLFVIVSIIFIILISSIVPTLSLITSYFYKRLVNQVEEKILL